MSVEMPWSLKGTLKKQTKNNKKKTQKHFLIKNMHSKESFKITLSKLDQLSPFFKSIIKKKKKIDHEKHHSQLHRVLSTELN